MTASMRTHSEPVSTAANSLAAGGVAGLFVDGRKVAGVSAGHG